ncbi:MAG: acyl-CoA thioesterase [Spirochaetia bacterium]|nr:acyl-CoA thioesterase [Spirochaetia bacterium]MDY4212005.1 thioesterase family protein [Treponema sp.]
MNVYTHKVNYYETDKMGITHHSNYIRFMEEARVDFLSQIGFPFDKIEEEGIISPVIRVEYSYRKTTTFADVISIKVEVDKLSPVKLCLKYELTCNGEVCGIGKSEHCFLNQEGRPVIVEKEKPEFFNALKNSMEKQ